jgi:hypothetical protein
MKGLEVYVKSSALGRTGIHWRKVSAPQQYKETPHILKDDRFLGDTGESSIINDLINETKLSLVLVRCDKKLLLEVTGIESPERSNRLGRKVLNSVVWIVDENDDSEKKLRELAARALLSFWGNPELINKISTAVEFDGLEGFKAKFNILYDLAENGDKELKALESETEKNKSNNQEDIWEKQQRLIDDDDDADIKSLTHQLVNSPLPEGKDLVVIAEMLKEGVILYRGIVWEETKSKEVETLPSIPSEPASQSLPPEDSTPTLEARKLEVSKKKRVMVLILASLLLITILSTWWILSQRQEKPQNIPIPQILISPQSETEPSPPTRPNSQTEPQMTPNQEPQKTP